MSHPANRDRARAMSTTDTGAITIHYCGAETIWGAESREHEAECCDCWLLLARWRHRLPARRGQLELLT